MDTKGVHLKMGAAEILTLIILAAILVINIVYYVKCEKKFKSVLFGMGSGVAVLIPCMLILSSAGYEASINIFSVTVSALLGLPGVALLVTGVML